MKLVWRGPVNQINDELRNSVVNKVSMESSGVIKSKEKIVEKNIDKVDDTTKSKEKSVEKKVDVATKSKEKNVERT